jgi:GAF domain-containing protein/anti-sigma regulatory factor (Ser/Thr protein kinase)
VARALLRAALAEATLEHLTDVALLLTTELCAGTVRNAGTEMELAVRIDDTTLTVSLTDRGPVPLELDRRAAPGTAEHPVAGPGLRVVAALASAWGTRHDATGRHLVWFTLDTAPAPAAEPAAAAQPAPAAEPVPVHAGWPGPQSCRWLLHMPAPVATRLAMPSLVTELLRRLCEVLGADAARVLLDYGDGTGEQLLAQHSVVAPAPVTTPCVEIRLALDAPLRGRLRVHLASPTATSEELATLSAHRIALAIESDWLRGADRRRRSWMTYLAETSELLAQSLDVNFTTALVPQIVVPRLGHWCAVHLVDDRGTVTRAVWGHADESALGPLRSWLDADRDQPGGLQGRIDEAVRGDRPVIFTTPVEGVTVPLIARSTTLGTLTVGRPGTRPHTPEDVTLISDVARRASLAIANAQLNAAHVAVAQAFQRALLPRALPESARVEFAAAYLPASTGTDVGGDFYDVLALPGERWLVAVGDVCGKGAPAAARTGRVRDVLRVLVRDGCRLERAVQLLNDVMGEPAGEQQFCTLAGALVAARTSGAGLDVELVRAGHDQPLLVRADGSTGFLGEFGTAVGLLDEIRLCTTRHTLAPGDTMVIYTDGVTERRHGNQFFGRARLAALAAKLPGAPAATMVAALRTAAADFSPDPPRDDIALLVVRAR